MIQIWLDAFGVFIFGSEKLSWIIESNSGTALFSSGFGSTNGSTHEIHVIFAPRRLLFCFSCVRAYVFAHKPWTQPTMLAICLRRRRLERAHVEREVRERQNITFSAELNRPPDIQAWRTRQKTHLSVEIRTSTKIRFANRHKTHGRTVIEDRICTENRQRTITLANLTNGLCKRELCEKLTLHGNLVDIVKCFCWSIVVLSHYCVISIWNIFNRQIHLF